MASIVLLLSELLGGESASVLAAERYMGGHPSRLLGEFRPAVTQAPPAAKLGQRPPVEVEDQQHASAGTEWVRRDDRKKEESFEDLAAVSRIAVDGIMWP